MQSNTQQKNHSDRSVGSLIRELMHELTALVRNESELAKAEISEKVSQLGSGVVSLVVAVVLLLIGLIGLMDAAIYGLALIWPMWLSALVIGGIIVVAGLIALAIGRSNLKSRNLTLDRTTNELRKEASFARDQTR